MKMHLPYIGNFSRGCNFRWVRDLPEIAKNRHSEKLTNCTSSLRVLEIAKIGLGENLPNLPSVIFRQNFQTRKIPDIRYFAGIAADDESPSSKENVQTVQSSIPQQQQKINFSHRSWIKTCHFTTTKVIYLQVAAKKCKLISSIHTHTSSQNQQKLNPHKKFFPIYCNFRQISKASRLHTLFRLVPSTKKVRASTTISSGCPEM